MRYIQREVRTERREEAVEAFLSEGGLAADVFRKLDLSPGALILDHLIPEKEGAESLDIWLLRQVRTIIAAQVESDEWAGVPGAWHGVRTRCTVETVELSTEDCAWLIERYARHPEVLAVWEGACRRAMPERVAA